MQIDVSEKSPVERLVKISVDKSAVDGEVKRRLENLRGRVKIRGFRKGKVPMGEIKRRYGKSVRVDAIQAVMREKMNEAARGNDELKGAIGFSSPQVVDGDDDALTFQFTAESFPDVQPVGYLGVNVQVERVEVDEDDIQEELERLQEKHTQIIPVTERTTVESGDIVVIDYHGIGEGAVAEIRAEDSRVDLGDADDLPAGLASGLEGAEVDKAREVEITLADDLPVDELAGKTVTIECTVKEIKRRDVPAIDDDLAQDTGEADTLDELREKIVERLTEEAKQEAERDARRRMLATLLEKNDIPLPPTYVERRLDERVQSEIQQMRRYGIDPDDIDRDEARRLFAPDVEKNLREALLLQAIASREKISIKDAEVQEELQRIADSAGVPLAKVKAAYQQRGGTATVAEELKARRTLDFIWSKANLEEVDEVDEEAAPSDESGDGSADGGGASEAADDVAAQADDATDGDEEESDA